MAKRKFQVGDRVRVITKVYDGVHYGAEGMVVMYVEGLYHVDCRGSFPFYPRELELIKRAEETVSVDD